CPRVAPRQAVGYHRRDLPVPGRLCPGGVAPVTGGRLWGPGPDGGGDRRRLAEHVGPGGGRAVGFGDESHFLAPAALDAHFRLRHRGVRLRRLHVPGGHTLRPHFRRTFDVRSLARHRLRTDIRWVPGAVLSHVLPGLGGRVPYPALVVPAPGPETHCV